MQRTKPAKQKIRGVFSTARKEKAEKRKRNKELFATLYDNVKDYKFKRFKDERQREE